MHFLSARRMVDCGKGWTACVQGVLAGCYYLLFISKVPQQCKSLNPQHRYLPSQETPHRESCEHCEPRGIWKIPQSLRSMSLAWSNKSKTTPPRVFVSPSPLLHSKKICLKPRIYLSLTKHFARKMWVTERSLASECHFQLSPGLLPSVTENLSVHRAHSPPCTHLTDSRLENATHPLLRAFCALRGFTAGLETVGCAVTMLIFSNDFTYLQLFVSFFFLFASLFYKFNYM